jgi:pilus assembly protein CpaB
MSHRLLSVFVFAVIVAGAASFLLYRLLTAHVGFHPKPAAQHKLVVAARDLQVGTLLKEADVRPVVWTGNAPPTGIVSDLREALGRGVVAVIYAGEPLLEARLARKGAGAGLAGTIPMGMRAVALRVNEVIGLAGFVVPGMRVDVIIAGNESGGRPEDTLSRTILQNIEVLSAGQKIEQTADGKPADAQVVNLLVTPDEAEALSLASSEAKVQLVLRNPLDTQKALTAGTSLGKLLRPTGSEALTHGSAPVRTHSAPTTGLIAHSDTRAVTVEVYQSGKKMEQTFALREDR